MILKKDNILTDQEKKDFYFKVNEATNIARYNDDEYMVERLRAIEKSMNDKISAFEAAYRKGYKKGIAIALLDILDNETIAKKTGLSVEEVEKLRQNQCSRANGK